MDRMACRSHAWAETAPAPLITVRRRALRELALDTILEEGIGMAGHLLSDPASAVADPTLASHANVLHQHRPHAVAFAQSFGNLLNGSWLGRRASGSTTVESGFEL